MTITSEARTAGPFAGDGVSTVFPFTFKVFATGDVLPLKTPSGGAQAPMVSGFVTAINADQDVSPGGTVTLTSPLAVGDSLILTSDVPYTQPADITNQGGLFPAVVTRALDRLAILIQQLLVMVSRAPLAAVGVTPLTYEGLLAYLTGGLTVTSATGASVSTRTLMAAIVTPANSQTAYLAEAGREGWFRFSTANLSASVSADTLQGLYVAPAAAPTGASGAWVRVWDGVQGYAEWFGAVANDGSADCFAAITACLTLCPRTQLKAADYYTASTVKHLVPNHDFAGVSSLYDSTYGNHATRLLIKSATALGLQIGPDSNPGGISQFVQGLKCSGISVARTIAPTIASDCRAIRVQYVTEASIEDVRGDESMVSWELNGTVATKLTNCSAKRTSAGTGAGTENWKGFYINGGSGIAAGGNASLYFTRCHADDTRAVKANGNGFYADQNFSDLYLDHCETVSCAIGMNFQGNGSTGADSGNVDVHISNPVNDSFSVYGILIQNLAKAGSIDIAQPYFGPASGATAALEVLNSLGAVTVAGGQLIMGAAATTKAVKIESSSGVRLAGTMIVECGATAIEIDNSTNCDIRPIIKNRAATGGAGVQLNGTCSANVIAPTIMGKASGTSLGIQVVGTGDTRSEYNCSGIDSATIAGGATNKLVRNGVQITTTGLTGTNLASGVMT